MIVMRCYADETSIIEIVGLWSVKCCNGLATSWGVKVLHGCPVGKDALANATRTETRRKSALDAFEFRTNALSARSTWRVPLWKGSELRDHFRDILIVLINIHQYKSIWINHKSARSNIQHAQISTVSIWFWVLTALMFPEIHDMLGQGYGFGM